MKKIALILALLTVFSLFTACNDDITEEPSATTTTTAVTTTEAPQINKYADCKVYASVDNEWNEICSETVTHYKNTAQELLDISFQGRQYTLTYFSTITSSWAYLDNIVRYGYYDPSLGLWSVTTTDVEFDPETREVLYFRQETGGNYVQDNINAGKTKYPQEQCQIIAKKFIKNELGEDLGYKLISTKLMQDVYTFTFSREFAGVDLYEPITVSVGVFGELLGYDFKRVGEMSTLPTLSDEDVAEIKKSVNKKLESYIGSLEKEYTVASVQSQFSMLTNGRPVMLFVIDTALASNPSVPIDEINMFVYLD